MEKKFGENEYILVHIDHDLVRCEYKEGTCITLDTAKEIMDLLSSMCADKRYYMIQDMKNLKWIDKISRDFMAAHPLTNQMLAWAFYSNQPLHNVMFNIYITFSKPSVKTAFFITDEEALNWIKAQK